MKNIAEELRARGIEPIEIDEKTDCENRVKEINEIKGDLKDYDCPICKNKGIVAKAKFEPMYGYHVVETSICECMKKRQMLRKAKNSGLGDYLTKRFDDYIAVEDWQKSIKAKAIEYCKNSDDKWFIMCGQSGSGKTIICCIISNYLLHQGKNVLYITWTDFISKLKRDMMGDNSNNVSDYLEDIKTIEVLYIDELLKKFNETDLKYIIEIINYRYTNNLKTIISSERMIDELIDIDEATFGRVIEKSDQYIINIPKDKKKNYRLRNII